MAEQTERANPYCKACGTRLSFSCGEVGPGCGAVIEPDWADLREMARAAGWSGRRDPDQSRVRIWGHYGAGRMFIDWEHGWARIYQGPHAIVVDLSSSGELHHETVHLLNPSPATVLAAAKLIGLIGGTS